MSTSETVSAEIPIEKLGPPGIRGQLHILAVLQDDQRTDTERLEDTSERQFKILARLSKSPLDIEGILENFTAKDGGSYLLMSDKTVFTKIDSPEGQFIIQKNEANEFSLVEFSCMSTSINDAKQKFLQGIGPFFDYMSYRTNSPVFIVSIRMEDSKNDNQVIEYTGPYQKSVVNAHLGRFRIEMAPIYAMYREAKNSHSDFYKFLCYYKILEGLLEKLRGNVYKAAKEKGVQLSMSKEVVPDSPDIIRHREHVGTPLKQYFDNVLTPQFRTAVAHFITDEGVVLNMSDPEHINEYASLILVSELCVRLAIADHESLLNQLHA
jgi:hypothetical protein